jgi:hypothetical protein
MDLLNKDQLSRSDPGLDMVVRILDQDQSKRFRSDRLRTPTLLSVGLNSIKTTPLKIKDPFPLPSPKKRARVFNTSLLATVVAKSVFCVVSLFYHGLPMLFEVPVLEFMIKTNFFSQFTDKTVQNVEKKNLVCTKCI